MAKLKRYELYEGDGEIIPDGEWNTEPRSRRGTETEDGEPIPDEPRKTTVYDSEKRRRYFLTKDEEDGLGPGLPLFDDFSRYSEKPEARPVVRPPEQQPQKQGGWIAVCVVCLLILFGLGLMVLPMLTGHPYEVLPLPSIAFANQSFITSDRNRSALLEARRDELYSDRIYQGIYIDNVHMGGATRTEAKQAVENANVKTDTTFDILVTIGNMSWHVNSERVPVSRNTDEMVSRAWAAGRSNTAARWGSSMPPFEERVSQVSGLRSYPLTWTTRQDYDHEALRTMAEGIANYVHRDPVNSTVASFNFSTKTFSFTEDQPGAELDPEKLYDQLANLLDNGVTQTGIRVTPEKILASMTKTELMNRFGLISAYTTTTTKNNNRNTNIKLSAAAINGVTVLPGETFSFNKTVGERTATKGYKEAAAISGGQSRDEIGGGVCQTSSTLFNAVARANLEIVDRSPHAWPSSYVEKGFDATVNWPDLDFQFRNNTDWPIFILAGYENRKVTVNIYGMSLGADVKIDLESIVTKTFPKPEGINYVVNTKLAPGESKKTVTARPGYEVQTWKVWYQGKQETRRELLFTTTYKAYQETVEYNPQ